MNDPNRQGALVQLFLLLEALRVGVLLQEQANHAMDLPLLEDPWFSKRNQDFPARDLVQLPMDLD